ncbi:MAG: DUF2577 domain-containing protein [Clostridiales bacterium]|jgi:hypothetical protein|nr:DUF2577 domain-containing protein [Clostridiales bacterium]
MDLLDVINSIIQTNTDAQKLTDIVIGTVVTADPLSIQITPTLILPAEVLILCESVQEKEYEVMDVTLTNVIGKYKREALAVDDKVIMLRVLKGQQFIVLSKV